MPTARTSARKPAPRPRRTRKELHELYEESVQCPEADILFYDRVYREWNGVLPRALREDFCGTAAICAAWVKWRRDNRAVGVDLHTPTIEHGLEKHIRPLGDDARRVLLLNADVRDVRSPKVDVAVAMNFSYMILKTREEMLAYFRAVRAGLRPNGLFILDIFGGWESQALKIEKRKKPGFTYIWRQASFDPISHHSKFHIDFRFKDGSEWKRAFTYDWRLWSVPEVRELLADAGFGASVVYWEGTDQQTAGGNGVFRRTERTRTCPGWIAYIVAGVRPQNGQPR